MIGASILLAAVIFIIVHKSRTKKSDVEGQFGDKGQTHVFRGAKAPPSLPSVISLGDTLEVFIYF